MIIIPNELRIGNWVNDAEPYEFYFQVNWTHIAKAAESGYQYRAIPLTFDWLERCGFTWDEESQVFSIQIGNALYLEYDKDFDCSITPEDRPGGSAYVWGEIKTVHRLQNLFYDLTGKELEIKPL